MLLYIFARLHENLLNHLQVIEMIGITIYNVQRAVTPKAGNSKLRFLCSAYHIMVICICLKFQKNISTADTYITEITIFNVQRAITQKVG